MPLDRSALGLTLDSTPQTAAPGAQQEWTVNAWNSASAIPWDQGNRCTTATGVGGVNVTLSATRNRTDGGGSLTMHEQELCLVAGASKTETLTLTTPDEPGTYTYSFQLTSADPPQVWANESWVLDIGTGGGSNPGSGLSGSMGLLALGGVAAYVATR